MKSDNFEDKIKNAKEILEKLMDPEITLSDSVKHYKDGMKELKIATKLLEDAQLELTEFKVADQK